jgi:hypothetical protein
MPTKVLNIDDSSIGFKGSESQHAKGDHGGETHADIQDQIDSTFTRLKVVLEEEAVLRRSLRDLFLRQKLQAERELELAQNRCKLIAQEQQKISQFLVAAVTKTTVSFPTSSGLHLSLNQQKYMPTLKTYIGN